MSSADADSAQATRVKRETRAADPGSGDAEAKRRTPTRIVLVGEFNSGKTSLVNALLGSPVLSASFVTRTRHPTVVAFAAKPSFSAEIAGRRRIRLACDRLDQEPPQDTRWLHVGLPLERLRSLRVVDTPGLGSGEEDIERRTLGICRQADTVVWCTPAMQAWKASEERAWLTLPERVRERGILAVTFEDAITLPADSGRLLARLEAEAASYFGRVVLASKLSALMPGHCTT
jgi:GTPase Era involved in 16S rRNA processing